MPENVTETQAPEGIDLRTLETKADERLAPFSVELDKAGVATVLKNGAEMGQVFPPDSYEGGYQKGELSVRDRDLVVILSYKTGEVTPEVKRPDLDEEGFQYEDEQGNALWIVEEKGGDPIYGEDRAFFSNALRTVKPKVAVDVPAPAPEPAPVPVRAARPAPMVSPSPTPVEAVASPKE